MKRNFRLFICAFLLFIASQKVFSQTSIAQAQSIFTYNFTRLVEWPADFKSGDFVICIYGNNDLYEDLTKYSNGKSVGTQHIVVKKVSNLEDINKCHILFVSYGKTKEIPAIISKLGSSKTLIIGEKKAGLDAGAAICFVIIEDKLKYEIKASNITKMGMKYNSLLENMAIAKH